MSFYEQILSSIVERDLRYKDQTFPDIVYFITGMEKYSEEKGVTYYHSLKSELLRWPAVERDYACPEMVIDLCDDMINTLDNKYFEALSEGRNIGPESDHIDMIKNHWVFQRYLRENPPPITAETKILLKAGQSVNIQPHILLFYYNVANRSQIVSKVELRKYAVDHGLGPDSFARSYYSKVKNGKLNSFKQKTFIEAIELSDSDATKAQIRNDMLKHYID